MYTHRHYMLTYDPPHTISVLLVLLQDVFLKFMDANSKKHEQLFIEKH